VVAVDRQRVLGVARLQRELGRRLRDLLDDPVGVELHELALDLLAGLFEVLERLRVEELDPELADDAAPAALQLRQRELVEDLVPRQLVLQHVPSRTSMSFSSALSSPVSPVSLTSAGSPGV